MLITVTCVGVRGAAALQAAGSVKPVVPLMHSLPSLEPHIICTVAKSRLRSSWLVCCSSPRVRLRLCTQEMQARNQTLECTRVA